MFKRILAVALAIVMVMAMAAIGVSAAEVSNSAGADTSSSATGAANLIYFNASQWKNVNQIYCHIWENGGDDFYGWKASEEKCEKVNGSLWSYDLSNLEGSANHTGGLQSGKDYCVIFAADTGLQTYDTTIGTACIGDTARLTGNQIENPVDSEKKGYESVWTKNKASYGPHFAISSIGNFLGDVLCPNENSLEVIGDWLVSYSGSQYCDPVEVLAKAYKEFGVKSQDDVIEIFAFISNKSASELGISSVDTMKQQLIDGYKKAYGKTISLDPEVVKKVQKEQEQNGGVSGGKTGNGSGSTGGSTGGTSTGTTGNSGSGADGQNDTILFVLAGVMLLAAGAFVVSRKRREF